MVLGLGTRLPKTLRAEGRLSRGNGRATIRRRKLWAHL
jgi:hypothetical protein